MAKTEMWLKRKITVCLSTSGLPSMGYKPLNRAVTAEYIQLLTISCVNQVFLLLWLKN